MYYWKKGTQQSNVRQPKRWLIYLEAGGQCYDEDSCKERWKFAAYRMMSSKYYLPHRSFGGIFSPNSDESPLHNANMAYLPYCTSDGHMGDVQDDLWGYKFRGQRTVRAMIKHLMDHQGLGATSGDTVVFGGFSAGARGAMTHLDNVAKELEAKGVNVIGLLDSPLYMDVETIDPDNLLGLNK